jgi:hypothetical protein
MGIGFEQLSEAGTDFAVDDATPKLAAVPADTFSSPRRTGPWFSYWARFDRDLFRIQRYL